MDNSNRCNQQMNWRQPNLQRNMQMNGQHKREYDSPRQNVQPYNDRQRINQLQDNEFHPNGNEGNGECDTIPDDLISNVTNETTTSSAFLEE